MDPPSSVRWELLSVEQHENETLERYLAHLQKMILRAYPDTQTRQLSNPMFVDTFLKGCQDKAPALTACDKNLETIEEAYKYVKLSGQHCKAIFGKKNVVRTVRKHDPVLLIVINLAVLLNISIMFRGCSVSPIVIRIRYLVTKVSLCQRLECYLRGWGGLKT